MRRRPKRPSVTTCSTRQSLRCDSTRRAGPGSCTRSLLADPTAAIQARAEAGLGQLAFQEDDAETAILRLTRAYELDPALDDPAAADTLGRAHARTGAEEEAATIFRHELELATRRDDHVNRVRFAVLLANALIDATHFSEAATLLSTVLAEMPTDSHPLTLARIMWSQSRLHAHKGNTALARRHARQALALLEVTEHTSYTARACRALAHIELDAGHPDEALRLIDRGERCSPPSGTPYELAVFALEEARALAQLGLARIRQPRLRWQSTPVSPTRIRSTWAEATPSWLLRSTTRAIADRALEIYELAIEFHEKRPSRFLSDTYTDTLSSSSAPGRSSRHSRHTSALPRCRPSSPTPDRRCRSGCPSALCSPPSRGRHVRQPRLRHMKVR